MWTSGKLTLAALAAAATLAAVVPTATAHRLEVSNQRIRISWTSFEFITAVATSRCAVVLEGSFHLRTLSKVSGQLIGYITRAIVTRPCLGGTEVWALNGTEVLNDSTTAPNTLPWHVQYNSFTGSLPSISSVTIQIIGAAFLAEPGSVICLYKSTQARPFSGRLNIEQPSGRVTGFTADDTREIPFASGAELCPMVARGRGTAGVTLLGTTTAIIMRLVA